MIINSNACEHKVIVWKLQTKIPMNINDLTIYMKYIILYSIDMYRVLVTV